MYSCWCNTNEETSLVLAIAQNRRFHCMLSVREEGEYTLGSCSMHQHVSSTFTVQVQYICFVYVLQFTLCMRRFHWLAIRDIVVLVFDYTNGHHETINISKYSKNSLPSPFLLQCTCFTEIMCTRTAPQLTVPNDNTVRHTYCPVQNLNTRSIFRQNLNTVQRIIIIINNNK